MDFDNDNDNDKNKNNNNKRKEESKKYFMYRFLRTCMVFPITEIFVFLVMKG